MIRTGLALMIVSLLVFPVLAWEDPKAPVNVVGKYDCKGTDHSGGVYTGTVTIKKNGDAYDVRWVVGAAQYVGVGVLTDKTLSVAWLNQQQAGVMAYVVQKDGTLQGTWASLGDPKGRVHREVLSPKTT